MTAGGIFTIINNDSKQEKIIYGTEVLNQRLLEVAQTRAEMGMDPVPTLADVEETHYLLTNAHFKPIVAIAIEYTKTRSQGTNNFNSTIQLPIQYFGDFYHDMAVHVVVDAPTVTAPGTINAGAIEPALRFCDYPGERFCQEVSFNVNGNVLDKYVAEDYVMYRQFKLQPGKKVAYDRCMGQEVAEESFSVHTDTATRREKRVVLDGPQTPKAAGEHSAVEMFIPLLFWFNTDVRLAIPAVSIPNGDRRIEIKTCTEGQLVQQQERGNGSSVWTSDALNISTCELIVNNLFVNNEIHDIYIDQVGFSLIRVHLRHTTRLNTASHEVLLNNIKWPIEVLYIGARPTVNVTALPFTDAWAFRDLEIWHRFASVSQVTYQDASGEDFYTLSHARTLDTLEISAYGVVIYQAFGTGFYNAYIPFTYGGTNIASPSDVGLSMITFCLYPGTYQVSSHLNTSRAREFYLKYTSSTIDGSNEADLYVAADALNFALLSDGSLVLRYYT